MKFSSTSPLRHAPAATIAILVIAIGVTILSTALGPDKFSALALQYGKGIKPLQWLTSTFVHPNMLLLASTLIPLACFCFFLEGKIGTPVFVIAFALIAVSANAAAQFAMQGYKSPVQSIAIDTSEIIYPGRTDPLTAQEKATLAKADEQRRKAAESSKSFAPGASPAVFGLMVICLMWAPLSSFIIGDEDDENLKIPMLLPVIVFIGAEAAKWFVMKFSLAGLPVHLIGLVPGLGLGAFFLAGGVVDQTNAPAFDLGELGEGELTARHRLERKRERKQHAAKLRQDRRQAAREKAKLLKESAAVVKPRQQQQTVKADPLVIKAQEAMEAGDPEAAFSHLMELKYPYERKHFEVEGFEEIAQHYMKEKRWDQVITVLKESIAAHETDAIDHQLKLAKIYLAMKRPEDCQARLGKIPRRALSSEQQDQYRQLVMQLRQAG
ncbi:MAG: rhomboid family intramembrane serine protease [Planctomycetota bacterium]